MASIAPPPRGFQPYVPASQSPAEFTLKAVVIGVLFGLLFGASTVYLGLRAGLTVSASIPIAVLAISVLKRLGGSTILENNIVQTIGSAGESVAGGVVFTIPALIFLTPDGPAYFNYYQIAMLAFAGGILGVLMMVPLRRALIVKEHGVLPYPEGTACADVLIAGERGGKLASMVFGGLGVGALWKSLSWVFNLFLTELDYSTPRGSQFPNATLNVDISPEYMGVGYVIGPRIAGTMFAGGVLSWLVLLPLLSILGAYINVPFPPIHPNFANNPATGLPFKILEMSPGQLWSAYIRYIGAGAVLAAGLITLGRTLPTIVASAREGIKDFGAGPSTTATLRTERDLPTAFVLGGSLLLAIFLAVAPKMPMQGNFLAAFLVIVFGFLFVTVSSRLTGEIGSSSNPISGMTVATLLLTCLCFVMLRWTGASYFVTALSIGGIVCIASSNGGTTSQDLKTGFLVGSTPRAQQIAILIGALASALVLGPILLELNKAGSVYIPVGKTLPAGITGGSAQPNERADVTQLHRRERVASTQANGDTKEYLVWHRQDPSGGNAEKYLVDPNTGRARDKSATTTADTVNHRTTLPDFATQSLATDRRLPRIGALVILPVSKKTALEREHSESKFLCEGSCQRVTRFNAGLIVRIELLVRLGPSEAHRLNTRH